jgi:hypothetical protein
MPDIFPIPITPGRAPTMSLWLDGAYHQLSVTWNVSAQRRYFNLYNQFGVWVMTAPLIETGPGKMLVGITYVKELRSMRCTMAEPTWRPLGQMVDYWLEGVDPLWLNGKHRSETIGVNQFMFPVLNNPSLTVDPGQIALFGTASRFANLVEGYMERSVLIFRNRQFEVFARG